MLWADTLPADPSLRPSVSDFYLHFLMRKLMIKGATSINEGWSRIRKLRFQTGMPDFENDTLLSWTILIAWSRLKKRKTKQKATLRVSTQNHGGTLSGDNQFHFLKTQLQELFLFGTYGWAPLLLAVTYPLSPESCPLPLGLSFYIYRLRKYCHPYWGNVGTGTGTGDLCE